MGMLDQPLTEYTSDFQFGEVDGGRYISGELVSTKALRVHWTVKHIIQW